jgi:uncharacterized protein
LNIVLDTNVVVSSMLFGGKPRYIFEAAEAGNVRLFASEAMLAELDQTMEKPHLKRHWLQQQIDVLGLIDAYRELVTLVVPAPLAGPVSRDSDDDVVIATAIAAGARLLVSGDKDLLVLAAYEGIDIVTVDAAITQLV